MIFVLGLDMASIPIKEQTMEIIISKIETAIDQVEPLRSRGDVKSICAAVDSIKSLFKDISDSETRLQHFIIVWALREPPFQILLETTDKMLIQVNCYLALH